MTKSTITRKRLQEIAEDGFLKHGESKELARMALAAMDSEPVILYRERNPYNGLTTGWQELTENELSFLKENAGENAEFLKLYRHAQPAPVVPEERPSLNNGIVGFDEGWNACRAAMLQAGNSPVIPDAWIPASERLPEFGDYLVTDGCDFDVQLFNGEEFIPGFIWEDKITHWMPLPSAPQEVKGE